MVERCRLRRGNESLNYLEFGIALAMWLQYFQGCDEVRQTSAEVGVSVDQTTDWSRRLRETVTISPQMHKLFQSIAKYLIEERRIEPMPVGRRQMHRPGSAPGNALVLEPPLSRKRPCIDRFDDRRRTVSSRATKRPGSRECHSGKP